MHELTSNVLRPGTWTWMSLTLFFISLVSFLFFPFLFLPCLRLYPACSLPKYLPPLPFAVIFPHAHSASKYPSVLSPNLTVNVFPPFNYLLFHYVLISSVFSLFHEPWFYIPKKTFPLRTILRGKNHNKIYYIIIGATATAAKGTQSTVKIHCSMKTLGFHIRSWTRWWDPAKAVFKLAQTREWSFWDSVPESGKKKYRMKEKGLKRRKIVIFFVFSQVCWRCLSKLLK